MSYALPTYQPHHSRRLLLCVLRSFDSTASGVDFYSWASSISYDGATGNIGIFPPLFALHEYLIFIVN